MRLAFYVVILLLVGVIAWLLLRKAQPITTTFNGQVGSNIKLPGITTIYNKIYQTN